MAFPDDRIRHRLQAAFGADADAGPWTWTWTDITSAINSQQVTINRGQANESAEPAPTSMSVVLDNVSGDFTPDNPVGAYYPGIIQGVPMRYAVDGGSTRLALDGTGAVSTPDAAALDITGDLDVRFDATLENWYPVGTLTELAGKYETSTNQRSWVLYTQDGRLKLSWSTDGTQANGFIATSAPFVLPPSARLAVRATLDVNNGAGGWTVTFYTADTIAGPWAMLGSPVATAGTTSIYASTAALRIGNAILPHTDSAFEFARGQVHAIEVRSGIDGTVVADPVFSDVTAGTTSFTDGAGRIWTLSGDAEINVWQPRFAGNAASWEPVWPYGDLSNEDADYDGESQVTVTASGILQRLGQGEEPLQSAMRREFGAPERTGIVAYWPCEDDSSATQIASALPGHPPIPAGTGVSLAAYNDWPASAPLPTLDTALLRAEVPYYDTTPDASLRFFLHVPQTGVAGDRELARLTTVGTATTWTVTLASAGHLRLRAFDREGDSLLDTGAIAFAVNGRRLNVDIELVQNGANIDWAIFTFNIDDLRFGQLSNPLILSGTLTGRTIKRVTTLRFGDTAGLADTALGHVALGAKDAYTSTLHALIGWSGERAGDRLLRLTREEGVPFTLHGDSTQTGLMGPQRAATLTSLLTECAALDGGILGEQRADHGLAYRTRTSMYNQVPAAVLDARKNEITNPFAPVLDDQRLRNAITVSRDDGSSAMAIDQDSINRSRRYPGSYPVNAFSDDLLSAIAGWRLHLGTWPGMRYPSVSLDLAQAPRLIDAWLAMDYGARFQVTNLPPQHPADAVDLLLQGYSETISPTGWTVQGNCTPAGPWAVGVVGDSQRGRIDANPGGSMLAVASVAGDGQLLVHTPAATDSQLPTPWITSVGRLTGNPDFELDTSGWTVTGGTLDRVPTPGPAPFCGSWSGLITPNGVTATVSAESGNATVTAGGSYRVYGWLRCATARTVDLCVNWYGTGGTFLSTTVNSIAVAANTWTRFDFTQTAPASAVAGRARPRMTGSPPSSDLLWFDVCFLGTGQLGSYPAEFPFDIRFGGEAARVLANAPAAWDTFTRTVSSAWGTADGGLTWQQSGGTASDRAVNGSAGTVTLAATPGSPRFQRIISQITDCEVLVRVSVDQVATGSAMLPAVLLRYTGTSDYYRARLHFGVSGAMATSVTRATTQVGTAPALPYTYTAGQWFWLRARLTGHRVQMRAWPDGQAEPTVWHSDQTITTEGPIVSGEVGVTASAFDSNTNVSPQLRYDDFQIVTPQLMTVQRSLNGIVKAHTAGTEVRLAQPAVVAL